MVPERRPAFAFAGSRLLLVRRDGAAALPDLEHLTEALGAEVLTGARRTEALGGLPGGPAEVFDLGDDFTAPTGCVLEGLRHVHGLVADADFRLAGTARQHLDWLRTHRFCSRCGAATERHSTHRAMACPECGQLHFPRLAPAVIVLVQREREILLGRSPHFPPGVYSTLAGFVEPGESLEECIARELEEEVGVSVGNLRYFGSQPHPFPHSLMIGFVADWVAGELRLDPNEIEDAGWFGADALPELPHPMSIARALIEDFLRRVGR